MPLHQGSSGQVPSPQASSTAAGVRPAAVLYEASLSSPSAHDLIEPSRSDRTFPLEVGGAAGYSSEAKSVW